MSNFVEDFIRALENRENNIDYNIQFINNELIEDIPDSIKLFYKRIQTLNITGDRTVDIFAFSSTYYIDDYLIFAKLDRDKLIAFNVHKDWEIVCVNNGYVITKTLASFLTNKIWAWVDKGRIIWEEESY